jgi:hypothetical protein
MTKTNGVLVAISLLLLIGVVTGVVWQLKRGSWEGRAPGRRSMAQQLMRLKSTAMADLRQGLEKEDYRLIERGITRLRQVNSAASSYLSDQQYGDQGELFLQELDAFGRHVASRDLPSARTRYVQLAESCASCHELIRGTSSVPTDLEEPDPADPPVSATE